MACLPLGSSGWRLPTWRCGRFSALCIDVLADSIEEAEPSGDEGQIISFIRGKEVAMVGDFEDGIVYYFTAYHLSHLVTKITGNADAVPPIAIGVVDTRSSPPLKLP